MMAELYEPLDDPAAAARECEERALEREGIPVVLAVEDLRPTPVIAADDAARADGAGLASLLRTYHAALSPESGDDDAAALYQALAVIGHGHVREVI